MRSSVVIAPGVVAWLGTVGFGLHPNLGLSDWAGCRRDRALGDPGKARRRVL